MTDEKAKAAMLKAVIAIRDMSEEQQLATLDALIREVCPEGGAKRVKVIMGLLIAMAALDEVLESQEVQPCMN